jgi:hypothetical protein
MGTSTSVGPCRGVEWCECRHRGALAARCSLTNLCTVWFHAVAGTCKRGETAQCLLAVGMSLAAGAADLFAARSMFHITTMEVVGERAGTCGLVRVAPSRN